MNIRYELTKSGTRFVVTGYREVDIYMSGNWFNKKENADKFMNLAIKYFSSFDTSKDHLIWTQNYVSYIGNLKFLKDNMHLTESTIERKLALMTLGK